jgi:colicin import membrane protein
MNARSPSALLLSVALHAALVLVAFLFGYIARSEPEPRRVLELVAGEGDNYLATEAPALGIEGGVKLPMPRPPEARPAAVEPTPPAPAPPKPTPTPPPPPPAPAEQPIPDFKRQIQRKIIVADSKAKLEIKRERAAEKKRAEEEAKRLTKEEFDRQNKARAATPAPKNAPPKVAKIDAEGIAKGVVGGSTSNRKGGAGGKALTANPDDVLTAYDSLFRTKLRTAFESPPGLSDTLKATLDFRMNADGSITGARISQSSGSAEFDRAVLEAVARVRMPPRPDKRAETLSIVFSMRDKSEG